MKFFFCNNLVVQELNQAESGVAMWIDLSSPKNQPVRNKVTNRLNSDTYTIEKNCATAETKLITDESEDDDNELTIENVCLLYTSPSPRDRQKSRMPSSA